MAILRPCKKFMRILTKISRNCQVRFTTNHISSSRFRGYVHSIYTATSCYNYSDEQRLRSLNSEVIINENNSDNDKKKNSDDENQKNINENVAAEKLNDLLERIRVGFQDMRVDYNDLVRALEIWESFECFDDTIGNFVLSCCGEAMPDVKHRLREELTQRVWKILEKKNPKIPLIYYHTYLSVCAQNYVIINPEEFINSMKIIPNADTYVKLLNVAARNGNAESANFILMKMRELNFPLNYGVMTALIELYSRRGDMKSVNDVLETITSTEVEFDNEIHGHLAWGYAIQKDIKNVLELLKLHTISDRYLLMIIKTLSSSGNGNSIASIFEFFSEKLKVTDPLLYNTVIELVHVGKLFDAQSIVNFFCKNYSEHEIIHLIEHFLKAIVRARIDFVEISNIGQELSKYSSLDEVLHLLLTESVHARYIELSFFLFEEIRKANCKVVLQNYRHLLTQAREYQGAEGIFRTLEHMNEMNVTHDYNTLLEFILPFINTSDARTAMAQLVGYGIPFILVFESLMSFLLQHGEIDRAISLYNMMKQPELDFEKFSVSLIRAYEITEDADSCVQLLKSVRKTENCGARFLLLFIEHESFKDRKTIFLQRLINAYSKHKLWISGENARLIHSRLSHIYGDADEIVTSVSFHGISHNIGDPEIVATSVGVALHPRNMNVEQLQAHLLEIEGKGGCPRGVLRKLFMRLCKLGDHERVEQVKKRLEEYNINLTFGMKATLLDLYASNGRVEEALNTLSDLKKDPSGLRIDAAKILKLALALVQKNEVDKALEIISAEGRVKFIQERGSWKLLDAIVRSSQPDLTATALNILIENGYCNMSTVVMSPLIRQYLLANDERRAVEVFKRAAQHSKTPLHQELVIALLQMCNNDSSDDKGAESMLRDVVDTIIKIQGKKTAEQDLIVGYAQCGMLRELLTVLKNPDVSYAWIQQALAAVPTEKKTQVLTTILDVSREIEGFDRNSVYELLLSTYCEMSRCEDAINLCRQMNDDGVKASEASKNALKVLLSLYRVQIPDDLEL